MDGSIAMPIETTMVEATGTLYSLDIDDAPIAITQIIPVPHQKGVKEPVIIAAAVKSVFMMGGLFIDNEGGVDFYPLLLFKPPIQFRIKKVLLAGLDALPSAPAPLLQ